VEDRHRLMRQQVLERRKEEEKFLDMKQIEQQEEYEEDESSEYESDLDYDDPASNILLKPVFVSKNQRETVKEQEALELEKKEKRRIQKFTTSSKKARITTATH